MKRGIWVLLAVLLHAGVARTQEYIAVQPPKLITVTGEAEVKVIPDEVVISLGLTSTDPDLATAKKLNNERVKNLLAMAEQLKIEPKHIQTGYISISRNDWADNKNFRVSRDVVITLKDMRKYDEVLTRLVQNNRANTVEGVNFNTSQLRKYRDQARAMAAQAAREKADALATALGVKAGKPYSIREESSYWSYWGGRHASSMMNAQVSAQATVSEASPSTTLSPGQISVSARLSVSFELE